jgi:phage recombination protein Bet
MTTELVRSGGSLAIRSDQLAWTEQQEAVLRQSGINNDVTSAELSAFLHLCQRTKLDPFSRQIYLIGRYDRRANRQVYTPQTSIDGYRVIASRVIAEQGANLGYEDTQWCDKDGRWMDVWLQDGPPAAARVTVLRNGQRFPAIALYREYVQTGKENKPIGLWGKMPAGQLAKCAEALALRKAFPHDLAGVYTAEEMAQADNPQPERHLRTVQPGDADQWATPADGVKGRSQPAQDFADQAAKATDPAVLKDVYKQANAVGLLSATVKTADRELVELGAYLIARGQQLATPAPEKGDDGVIEGEIVPSTEEQGQAAEEELRQFAQQVGLPGIDADFEAAKGLPLTEATADQIRGFLNELRGTAA